MNLFSNKFMSVINRKNQQGEVIGFEKLNYTIFANTNLKISLETAIAT
jgi:hypothetical protein